MFPQILPLAAGAVAGALSRWLLGLLFARSTLPFCTGILAANWTGAFLIGVCAQWLDHPQWKLLLITGFLGSLTTFSSFSLEMVALMQAQRWGAALATLSLHVFGSFLLTAAGMLLAQQFE